MDAVDMQTYQSSKRELSFFDAMAFLIPVSKFIELDIVGRLFMSDVLLLVLLPVLVAKKGRLLSAPLVKITLFLAALWFIALITSDLIRETQFSDYARGWAKTAFFISSFISLYLLFVGSNRRIILFAIGLAVGILLTFILRPSAYSIVAPWKFGYGGAVTLLLVLIAVYFTYKKRFNVLPIIIVLLFTTGLNFYMGFRSIGGMTFMAAGLVALQFVITKGMHKHTSIKPFHILLMLAVLIPFVIGLFEAYSYAASNGLLGRAAMEKYQMQSVLTDRFGGLGLLLAGRSEIFTSTQVIGDSPFIGQGSWPKSVYYTIERYKTLQALGFQVNEGMLANTLIATHSYLFGSWVEAGIFGGIFWLWAFFISVFAIISLVGFWHPLTPLFAFWGVDSLWVILFSPFGADGRMTSAATLAVMLIIIKASVDARRTASLPRKPVGISR